MAFLVSAGLVVLTILFLTGLFVNLPEAVLGAVVIHAVSGMIKPLKIWGLHQIRVPDFWLALFAFLGVILIGVMAGILIGVVLSMVLLLGRLGTPHTAVLAQHPDRGFVDSAVYPAAVPVPGVLVFRVDGPLVFASVDGALDDLRDALREAGASPDIVVLDLSACYEIDVTAADALAGLVDDLRRDGIEVRFAAAHHHVRDYAARLGLRGPRRTGRPLPDSRRIRAQPRKPLMAIASPEPGLPVHRLDTLPERLSRYPSPVGGLALGIASLGLAWERVLPGTAIAEVAAGVATVLLGLMTLRFVLHPDTLARDLAHPVVGGVAPTYAMGWMIVSISIHQVNEVLGTLVWLGALGIHVGFLVVWARHQARSFHLARMVPSWFVPPVGIIVAAVSYRGPDTGVLHGLAVVALYFGMLSYAVMLPLMFYRFIFDENIPVAAMPTLAILAAPASLSLVGYLTLIEAPEPLPVILLEGIAVLMTAIVYVAFVRLAGATVHPRVRRLHVPDGDRGDRPVRGVRAVGAVAGQPRTHRPGAHAGRSSSCGWPPPSSATCACGSPSTPGRTGSKPTGCQPTTTEVPGAVILQAAASPIPNSAPSAAAGLATGRRSRVQGTRLRVRR